jgi:basic membrane lipoprotein Med (substrate-binding protein (PBP1-ABC) superfamily)
MDMKRLFLSLALAGTVAMPIAASAQQAPPSPPTQAQREQMHATFEKMRTLHDQFRTNVLGALSPAHRQLLAQVAGNLAIAEKPDYRAAAQKLDAALSPSERNAIMSADQQMRSQMKSIMANMPKPQWAHGNGAPPHRMGQRHQPTAGGILLGIAAGRGMMMGRMWGGPHGGAPPPQQ